jgi:dienelactone hydrolase
MVRSGWAVVALTLGFVVGGCGSDDPAAPEAKPSEVSSSTPPYDPLPWSQVDGPLGRCGPQPQRVAEHDFRGVTLRDPGNATMPAVVTGEGDTVAVLLHQTDWNGYCGWVGFAQELTKEPGVTVLSPDLCGYGEAKCRDGYSSDRQTDQVRIAIDYAERELGARRIVLVGASMGGSVAVLTAAEDRRVDALVDLSGPEDWEGGSVSRAAARLTAPVLVAMATDEGPQEVAAAQAAVDAAPQGSEFVEPEEGHGYVLLAETDGRPTDLAARVRAWIQQG